MNDDSTAGPIMDTNWVFDQIAVQAAPLDMTLTATPVVTDPVTTLYPGTTAAVDFVWTFAANTAATPFTPLSGTSFMVHLELGASPSRADDTDEAPSLYPIDYQDWTWTASCENVQFGNDSEDTEVTPHPTLAANPTCTDTNGVLTFVVPQLPTSEDWGSWSMKFRISVTTPNDRHSEATTLNSWFSDLQDENVYAVAGEVASFMQVVKPIGDYATAALVAFGADPEDTTMQGQGVGVYSSVFCIDPGADGDNDQELGANMVSNCGIDVDGMTFTNDAYLLASNGLETLIPNSIEVEWTIPFNVPNDRTQVDVECSVNGSDFTESDSSDITTLTRWTNDPMRIYSSSLITSGMGTANCFYNGVLNANDNNGKHEFRCINVGAIAAGGKLTLGW